MTMITRENIDELLDASRIEALMRNGRWWGVRRNGATRKWKRDPSRIRVPVKYGFRGTYAITEGDFGADGALDPSTFRVRA